MRSFRRLVALLLLVTLGLGVPVLSAQAGDIASITVDRTAGHPDRGGCGVFGGGETTMSSSACFAGCVGVQAEAFPSGSMPTSRETFRPLLDERFSGGATPPEPHPPRLNIVA